MVKKNKIEYHGLGSRVVDLRARDDSTLATIAATISEEAGESISPSAVKRYLVAREDATTRAIEKSDQLKSRIAEVEINTIDERQKIISLLKGVAARAINAGDLRAAVGALREATNALNSLDQRVGKYTQAPSINVNASIAAGVVVYLPDNDRSPNHDDPIDAEYESVEEDTVEESQ